MQIEESSPGAVRNGTLAALCRTTVSLLGIPQRPSRLQHDAEIERGDRVAAFIGTPERRLGLGLRPLLLEQDT
ncbi:MAG: hypothetical protein JOY89_13785, partial [Solirubrobacterales bacterium]|nr:hypothetical protein [Solirubrobacterales bacterium]